MKEYPLIDPLILKHEVEEWLSVVKSTKNPREFMKIKLNGSTLGHHIRSQEYEEVLVYIASLQEVHSSLILALLNNLDPQNPEDQLRKDFVASGKVMIPLVVEVLMLGFCIAKTQLFREGLTEVFTE